MAFVNVVRSLDNRLASLQIDACAFCALPPVYQGLLRQLIAPNAIPTPAPVTPVPVQPLGGPVCVLVAPQTAHALALQAEDLIRKGLGLGSC